jgi:hypothetical protein
MGCLSPAAEKELAGNLALIGLFQENLTNTKNGPKTKENIKLIRDVLDKHGVTFKLARKLKGDGGAKEKEKIEDEVLGVIKDRSTFLIDMLTAQQKVHKLIENPRNSFVPFVKVVDLKSTATRPRPTSGGLFSAGIHTPSSS